MSEVRFIADSMLGSLARWLRILGFDTLYYRDIRDKDLVRLARLQGRIIITRDIGLSRSRKVDRIILVKSNGLKDQLKEFLQWIKGQGIKPCPFTLCPVCNGDVHPVDKFKVRNDVPEYIFLNTRSFYQCSNCGKVYWEGSHRKGIERVINQINPME
ncbi:MAG: Mut7-C RNAse domain-containing protein [Thermodesulfovibrionales bacterium]